MDAAGRREIIIVHGDEVSCEDCQGMTAEVVMECFDSLMPDPEHCATNTI
jgi:hypothetical protein